MASAGSYDQGPDNVGQMEVREISGRGYPQHYDQGARARDSMGIRYNDDSDYDILQPHDYDQHYSSSHPNHSPMTDRTVGGSHSHPNGGDVSMSQ